MKKILFKPMICLIPIQDDRFIKFYSFLKNGVVALPQYDGDEELKLSQSASDNIYKDFNLYIPKEDWIVGKETKDYYFMVSTKKINSDSQALFQPTKDKLELMLASDYNKFECHKALEVIQELQKRPM